MSLFSITFEESDSSDNEPKQSHSKQVAPPAKVNQPKESKQRRPIHAKQPVPVKRSIAEEPSSEESAEEIQIVTTKKKSDPPKLPENKDVAPPKKKPQVRTTVKKVEVKPKEEEEEEEEEYYEEEEEEEEIKPKPKAQKPKTPKESIPRAKLQPSPPPSPTQSQSPSPNSIGKVIQSIGVSEDADEEEILARLRPAILPYLSTNELVPYRLTRDYKNSVRGKRIHFQFSSAGAPMFHSKLKSKTPKYIFITTGTETHLGSTKFEGVVLVGEHNTTFSLRKDNAYGDEIMSIKYELEKKGTPRSCVVYFFNDATPSPPYNNKKPSKVPHNPGSYFLDFKNRMVMQSIKNCIIEDENGNEVILCAKVEMNSLLVEAKRDINPLCAFTFGISSYLCKL